MYPHYSWLEEGEYDRLYKEMIEPNLSHFLKGSLIPAVKETILQMQGDHNLPMNIHNIGPYWDKNTSFDLLAHDSMNNIMAVELVTAMINARTKIVNSPDRPSRANNRMARLNLLIRFSLLPA